MKVINKNMPEPYKYETDYRKIPREYLNPRIPQGRTMVKWAAFKTMPEQYQILDQYMENQNKVDMPLLSQEQIENINMNIQEKLSDGSFTEVNYWKNGYIFTLNCYIKKVDEINGYLIVSNESGKETLKISLFNLVSLE